MEKESKPIKVFQLVEWFELGGGLERIASEIACGLDKQKFHSEVWCIDRGGKFVDICKAKGISVRILNISSYFNPINILKLVKLFQKEKPDIIHSHVYYAATIGRIAARLAGVKVIVHHVHSTYWHYSSMNLFIEKTLSFITDKIICVSQAVKEFVMNDEHIAPEKITVIYNGISKRETLQDRRSVRASLGTREEDILITIVASLFENKGHRVLLEAISLLKDKYPSIKCWFVGGGPMETELKEHVMRGRLQDHVVFLGYRMDVPEILSASDIFVLTSLLREGQPLSVLEAWAYGVPVIASRVGGIPEIVQDKKNGLLVPAQEPQLLADRLEKLILDPQERIHLGREGKKTFDENFDVGIMIKKIEGLYEECLRAKL